MALACVDCHLRNQPLFRPMSADEIGFVARLKSSEIDVPAHQHIVRAGGNGHQLYTLLSGWAFSYKLLPQSRRQVLNFLLPGDFIGLQSQTMGRVEHSVCSITAVTLCVLDGEPFATVFAQQSALASSLLGMLVDDQTATDTRLLQLGREHPTRRLAYLLLELRTRWAGRGILEGEICRLPLTYALMADATGMSRSQLAQSLSELRQFNWVISNSGWIQFGDNVAIAEMAADCGYVARLSPMPRAIL